ncbi:N-acyl-L-homoserine lactone synthetase [Rhizobium sp. R72]|uniref:acyl-homoserine-lactone synthase n=1 Tax=unclassified Rhizobium TaxID=2613769 RepID=UPI000B5381E3|nr:MULTISPECIES: acyl-homoserine-lactone synthase [unclassified Rhizobium]OWW02335.1 N-acyl-L-homoserine lactone synthetase [Rhizobium sp. R72]OWW02469.1 N-acyl-L-homoserine lactone synthetase [Rhizobium sp. R711]
MLRIIREADDPELMERVWLFRHRRFVEQLGWEELRRQDGRERDQYDRADAIHAVLVHGDRIIGYSRLLPTTRPHFARSLSRHLSARLLPSGSLIFEWSRCATALDAPSAGGHSAADLLMTGVLECLVHLNASEIVFVTYTPLVDMMQRRGYPVKRLSTVALGNGDRVEIVSSSIPPDLLSQHQQTHGIRQSLLVWGRDGSATAQRPPTAA